MAVVLLGAGVVVAMLLSSGQMADLRIAVPLLSRAMNWLEFPRAKCRVPPQVLPWTLPWFSLPFLDPEAVRSLTAP